MNMCVLLPEVQLFLPVMLKANLDPLCGLLVSQCGGVEPGCVSLCRACRQHAQWGVPVSLFGSPLS